jgi:hypothetical protein
MYLLTRCFVCKTGTLKEMELKDSDKVLEKKFFGDLIVNLCILIYSVGSN